MGSHFGRGGGHRGFSGGNSYGGGMSSRAGGLMRVAAGMTWGVAIVGVAVLSLAAIVGFVLVDPVLNILASLAGVAVTSGKEAATLFGAGEMAGVAIDAAKASDLPAQLLALLAFVAKPLIVVGWAFGVVVLLALPIVASKIGAASRRWRD